MSVDLRRDVEKEKWRRKVEVRPIGISIYKWVKDAMRRQIYRVLTLKKYVAEGNIMSTVDMKKNSTAWATLLEKLTYNEQQ